jgi:hypothetical protein
MSTEVTEYLRAREAEMEQEIQMERGRQAWRSGRVTAAVEALLAIMQRRATARSRRRVAPSSG